MQVQRANTTEASFEACLYVEVLNQSILSYLSPAFGAYT